MFTLVAIVLLINFLQNKYPNILVKKLRSWNFLPVYLRSLKPYDEMIKNYLCCMNCCKKIRINFNQENLKPIMFCSEKNITNHKGDGIKTYQLKDKTVIKLIDF